MVIHLAFLEAGELNDILYWGLINKFTYSLIKTKTSYKISKKENILMFRIDIFLSFQFLTGI